MNQNTPEAEENLKACLAAENPSSGHLPQGVWRQPKGKERAEGYVTKDHPDKLQDAGPGRHGGVRDVALCDSSLAGKCGRCRLMGFPSMGWSLFFFCFWH